MKENILTNKINDKLFYIIFSNVFCLYVYFLILEQSALPVDGLLHMF